MTRNAKAGVKRGAGRSRVRCTAAALAAAAGIAGISRQALAANGTWVTGGASATWTDSTNWASGAVPGVSSLGSTTNTDTATFNAAVGAFGTSGSPIVIPSNFNIENINFDTAAGNFYVGATGGNSITSTTGGAIQILSTLTSTNAIETINAPLSLTASGTTFSLLNYSANGAGASAGTLNFGGAISGGSGGATLILGGTNTNANTISGVISNDISLVSAGSGLWVLTGANSYSGGTTISGGTLEVGNGTSGSLASGSAVTFAGTGTLNINEAPSSNQNLGILNANSGDATVQSTLASGNTTLTFSQYNDANNSTTNFVASGGTTNNVVLTQINGSAGAGYGWIDQHTFFNGSNYAFANGSGVLRGISYTAGTGDSGAATTTGGSSGLPATGNGGGSLLYAQTTGAITGQGTQTLETLNIVNTANSAQAFTLAAGATLSVAGILRSGNGGTSSTTTISGGTGIQTATNGGELVIRTNQANDLLTISTPILANGGTGATVLAVGGAGTTSFTALNTFTGNIVVNSGTLSISSGSNGTYSGVGANTSGKTVTIAPGATLITSGTVNDAIDYQSTTVNNLSFTIQGTWSNNPTNATSGFERVDNITLQGATINDEGQYAGGSSPYGGIDFAGIVTVSGSGPSSYNVLGSGSGLGVGTVSGSGNTTFNVGVVPSDSGGDFVVNGAMRPVHGAANVGIIKTGLGTMVLTGASSYTGATVVSAGTLQIGNGTSGSISNSSAVSISAGTLAFDEANNSAQSFNISNAGTIAGVEGSGITNTLSGVISGSGGFTQAGAGGTTLSGDNTFSGNVQVSAGTLTLTLSSNGTYSGLGANTVGRTVTIASGATLVTTNTDAVDYQSTTVNNLAFTIQGTWNNDPANTATGFQRVDNLTLQGATINDYGQNGSNYGGILVANTVNVSGSAPSTYNQLGSGVGLGLGGTGGTTVPVTFNISVTNSNDATIASDADFIVNGALRNTHVSTGSLIKAGMGTMVLNNASSYSGNTTVSAGTLRANNPTAGTSATGTSNITVAAGTSSYGGGRLGGSGYVSGSVTLNTSTTQKQGGIIAAGQDDSTTGTLTTGAETWYGGSAYEWKIGSLLGSGSTANAAPGSGGSGTPGTTSSWDDVVMTGLTVSSGGTSKPVTIALQNTATLTTASNASTYSWIIAQSSAIPTLPGSSAGSLSTTSGTKTANLLTTTPSGSGSDIFALDTSGWGSGLTINGAAPAGTFSLEFVNVSGTYDLDLDYNAAPEPGTAMLIAAGAAPLLLRRRRRAAAFKEGQD